MCWVGAVLESEIKMKLWSKRWWGALSCKKLSKRTDKAQEEVKVEDKRMR
jgi:hypothetical protein